MKTIRFTIFDRAKIPFLIKTNEDFTLGQVLDSFFPDNQRLTLQQVSNQNRILISRNINIKKMIKDNYYEKENLEYHLINLNEYVDIYINSFTKNIIKYNKSKIRYYCTELTTIKDLENQLSLIFMKKNILLGIYGIHENIKTFRLKPDSFVLTMKNFSSTKYFFQLQLNDCIEAVKYIKPTIEARFYRLDFAEQNVAFKKSHLYSLREDMLIKIRNNRISDVFFNLLDAKISIVKSYMKNILIIESVEKKWILGIFSEKICHDVYHELLAVKKVNNRKIIERFIDSNAKSENVMEDDSFQNTNNSSEIEQKDGKIKKQDKHDNSLTKNTKNGNFDLNSISKNSQINMNSSVKSIQSDILINEKKVKKQNEIEPKNIKEKEKNRTRSISNIQNNKINENSINLVQKEEKQADLYNLTNNKSTIENFASENNLALVNKEVDGIDNLCYDIEASREDLIKLKSYLEKTKKQEEDYEKKQRIKTDMKLSEAIHNCTIKSKNNPIKKINKQ